MEVARVAVVVAHKLPVELDRVLYDLGIIVAHLAVEGNSAAHAVPGEHLHDAKDADAVAIVTRGPVDDIRRFARSARYRLIQRKGLDVGDDPEGDARAIRPGNAG